MNENIKALIIRFLNNLKKFWFIGFACVILAIAFVSFIGLEKNDRGKTNVSGEMVGNNSITKIVWDFETEENSFLDGAVLGTQVSVAKAKLEGLLRIGKSSYVANAINEEMQKAGYEKLNEDDVYEIATVGHNMLDVRVYGTNAERVELIERLLRTELIRIVTEDFNAVSTDEVLKPMLFYAQSVGTGYELTSQPYQKMLDDASVNEVRQKKSIFTMNNILIVISSIALWLTIVLLLTISDGKIYTMGDIENIGIVCYGVLSKDKGRNRQTLSIIHKRMVDATEMPLQMLVFGRNNYLPETMLGNDIITKLKEKKAYSNWQEEGVEKIDIKAQVLLAIHVGECTSDEIARGLKALEILNAKCIGCILFS